MSVQIGEITVLNRGQSYLKFVAPRFFIEIDGKTADTLLPFVSKYTYKDSADKADELTITLNNKGLLWQDDFRFARGSKIRTRWGYPGWKMSDIKTLTVVEADFRVDTDLPVFEIKAHDADRTRMTQKAKVSDQESKPKNWGFVSSSDIARQIAKRYNLKMDIEESNDVRKQFRVQPANTNDYELLGGLSQPLNFEFYVEGGVLHFHKRRTNIVASAANYTYYTDQTGEVLQFSAGIKLKKPGKSGKAGVDPQTGETISADATSATATSSAASAGEYAILSLDQGGIYFPTPETSIPVTTIQAKAKQGKNDMDGLKANIDLVGDPKLMSKRVLNVNGVGKTYGGRWYIKEAEHVITPDGQVYVTKCELARNLTGKGKKEDKVADPAAPGGANGSGDSSVLVFTSVGGIDRFTNRGEDWVANTKK